MRSLSLLALCIVISCNTTAPKSEVAVESPRIFTQYSDLPNSYQGFHSPHAINAIATMENRYFNTYEKGTSSYFGTVWASHAEASHTRDGSLSTFDIYQNSLPDSACPTPLHCTIYANIALQAGLGDQWKKLSDLHEKQWGNREYAGWSVAWLLCKHFGWKAYLIIEEGSPEYEVCKRAFRRNKIYPVYRQPAIPLEASLEPGRDDEQIQQLLEVNEFGWGFSYQGWHTWITRFTDLKECYWGGAPSRDLVQPGDAPLFLETPFLAYRDYASHVICFPPRGE